VKVCGITRARDARYAGELGAWAVGVLLFTASPRSVTPERAQEIFNALPAPTLAVAVSNTRQEDELAQILSLSPDAIQIYHPFALPRKRAYRVFRVYGGDGIPPDCDAVVIDESHGTGRPCDFDIARRIGGESPVPLILSGGLTPDNVAAAVDAVHPCAVDVSSGVESSAGCKDEELMKLFFRACEGAAS
jgi:phosphoribosylanthranilate isomerase